MNQFTNSQSPDQAGSGRQIRQKDTPAAKASQGLARWYWGVAGLLIVTALNITASAARHFGPADSLGDEMAAGQAPEDDNAAWADRMMSRAEGVAMAVMSEIAAKLDRAFVPV